MQLQNRRFSSSRRFLLMSFFGAAMIAGAMAYNNYRFSMMKFIDFGEFVFYVNDDIFVPEHERYTIFFFSSNNPDFREKLANISDEYPILAIDFSQKRFRSEKNVIYITSGSSTILKFARRFSIDEIPIVFAIDKVKKSEYKQSTRLMSL